MAEDSATVVKDEKEEEPQHILESQINTAMRARIAHFKEQSDSLTFEGVRRLLEKDLGLEKFTLDVHKRFIKQLLNELLECANDGNDSKNEESEEKRDNVETGGKGEAREEQTESSAGQQQNSPVLGLLTGHKTTKPEAEESKGVGEKKAPSKGAIKTALRKRARYLRDNSEKLTLAGLRRLLEEDLELEMYSLDPYKKLISEQVDEVMNLPEVSRLASSAKKKSQRKMAKKVSDEEGSDSTEGMSDEDEDRRKPRKKIISKGKDNNEPKKRKKPTKDAGISGKKRIKAAEKLTQKNSDADGNVSEDGDSQSSAERSTKKKVVSTPAYGKRVEHLKTVIKACGMSVPPSVYKKVKQAPDNKRESHLIKELEEILSKEGLSANPTEKEIKEVRKKKERAKELEGIDTSNIVSSTRRRSTSFVAPPKPKVPVESDSENTEDEDDGNNNDDEEEEDDNNEDEDDDNGNDSQSEESDADDDEENSD